MMWRLSCADRGSRGIDDRARRQVRRGRHLRRGDADIGPEALRASDDDEPELRVFRAGPDVQSVGNVIASPISSTSTS
jgi:hypothetical protein